MSGYFFSARTGSLRATGTLTLWRYSFQSIEEWNNGPQSMLVCW